MPDSRHQFHTTLPTPQSLEHLGTSVADSVLQMSLGADENAAAALREIQKYAQPAAEAVAAAGAIAAMRSQSESLANAAKAGKAAQKLINAPADTVVPLSIEEQWLLKRNHKQVEDMILLRKTINDMGGIKIYKKIPGTVSPSKTSVSPPAEQITLNQKATPKMHSFLNSPKFFDLRKRASIRAVTWYLQNSKNDILHNLDIRRLSCRDIRRLLHKDKRTSAIDLSETDRAALRLLLKHKGRENLRRQYSARMGFARQKAVMKLLRQVQNAQSDFSKGLAITAAAGSATFSAAMLTAKGTLLTERFWKKHTRLGRLVGRGERAVLIKAGQGAAWAARQAGAVIRSGARHGARQLSGAVIGGSKTPFRAKTSGGPGNALSRAFGARTGKHALRARKAASGALQGANEGLHTTVAKIKAANAALREQAAKIAATKAAKRARTTAKALGKVGKTALGTALIPFKLGRKALGFVYRLFFGIRKWVLAGAGIIALFYFVLVLIFNSVMNMEDEEQTLREHAIQIDDETWVGDTSRGLVARFEAAVAAARAVGETYDNYTLRIVDCAGNELGAGINNAKDVLVASYVMLGGAEAFTDNAARDAMVEDLWVLMNPPAEYVESEIYFCSGCTENADGAVTCPGHRDVDITITVLFLTDLQKMTTASLHTALNAPSYARELNAFFDDGGWDPGSDANDNILWASNLYTGDWITLYGADPGSDGGYATGVTLSTDDIRTILRNTETSGEAKRAISYALSKVGCPYDQDYHGSTSVDIFDCSSLVYRAYSDAGIDISNAGIYTAAEELRAAERRGQIVNKADIRPGDLIFFATDGAAREGRYKSCGHVALYVGDGRMVEAKGKLWGVTYSQLRTNGIVGISRPE